MHNMVKSMYVFLIHHLSNCKNDLFIKQFSYGLKVTKYIDSTDSLPIVTDNA